ncbi:MAG: tRNA pseudouridine(38-40) synthase TruA [Bifidobacteriaceae bacterium]|jgi:tRNA pseudouridine38-40 synthase|nr:tRNA pseudouridine(38-40) synthase TruA [Bifidobacteriaceae bacterium]MCI1979279.1 tRNA pseudouridine(38-40) synthase TruA [Bifidobacteriaceae bacterium]
MTQRLRIDLAYDGTHFHGWAKQPQLRTVQGEVEAALTKILRIREQESPAHLVVAGRTDTGVHARHQVCHMDIEPEILMRALGHLTLTPEAALCHRLQHVVPDDIVIYSVERAPEGFDARFSALERTYVYRICDSSVAVDPRIRSCVLKMDSVLDEDRLRRAAAMIVGLKDFGSFATPNPGGTTIREVKVATWNRVPSHAGDYGILPLGSGLLEFTIVADAFAHNMVRSLVGAQVQVGVGKKSLEWFAEKLAVPVREGSTGPIAPEGLTLEHVSYPDDAELGERAQKIRARRTLPVRHV